MNQIDDPIQEYSIFIDEYDFLLANTWKNANAELRKSISEHNLKLLSRGADYWNSFIRDICKSVSSDNNHLLEMISFHFENIDIDIKKINDYHFPFLLYFDNCKFTNNCEFFISNFSKRCFFTNVEFKKKLSFQACDFKQSLYFQNSTFSNDFLIAKSIFNDDLIFNECVSIKDFAILISQVEGLVSIDECVYKELPPSFNGSIFKRPIDVSTIKYDEAVIYELISQTRDNSNNAASFRLLKNMSYQNSDHYNALRYFSYEMKSQETSSSQFTILSKIYGFTSNYGRSYLRPIISLLFIFLIFFNINTRMVNPNYSNTEIPVAIYTLKNTLPFGLGFDKQTVENASSVFKSKTELDIGIQFISMINIIISYVLWFLFLLSIRNRFKIK